MGRLLFVRRPEAVVRQDARGRIFNANADQIHNAEMAAAGTGMYLAFHRAIIVSKGMNECARRATAAVIPT